MICKIHQDDLSANSWNLWDGMVIFEPTDHGSDEETARVPRENLESHVDRVCENGQRLEFRPMFTSSRSRPSSRIGSRLAIPQRPLASVNKDFLMDDTLPDSKEGGVQRRKLHYPVRSGSPTNRFDFVPDSISQRIRTSPTRDTSDIAAACFAVGEDKHKETRLEPFDVRLADIIFVQSNGASRGNSNVGVINISIRKCGSLEIIPDSIHARDVLLAFLQAALPKGVIEDRGSLPDSKVLLSKPSSQSFDMQDFEENAVQKTVDNESLWDRMARKSATFAVRFKECECWLPFLKTSVFVSSCFSHFQPNRCHNICHQCVYVVIMECK